MSLHRGFFDHENRVPLELGLANPNATIKNYLRFVDLCRNDTQMKTIADQLPDAMIIIISGLSDEIDTEIAHTGDFIHMFHRDTTIYVDDTRENMEKFLQEICPGKYHLWQRGDVTRVVFRDISDMAVAILALDKPWEKLP